MDSANQLGLWQEPLPGYFLPREPSIFVPLLSCVAFRRGAPAFVVLVQFSSGRDPASGLGDQEEPSSEARRALLEELEQVWVSRPTSLVPPMLSLFRPMLSPGHPTPFSVERAVVQRLNLVFGTSKPAQKESETKGRESFSYHRWIRSCLVVNEQIGEGFDVKRKLTFLRRRRSCRSNCDHFDSITPGMLDIGKNCQHRQTNHNHRH